MAPTTWAGLFSADGQFIATVSNISNFSRSAFARGSGNGFASPRKEEVRGMAATRDLRLLVVNVGVARSVCTMPAPFSLLGNLAGNPHALGVAVLADGTQILTAGEDHVVRLWNGLSKQEVRALHRTQRAVGAAWLFRRTASAPLGRGRQDRCGCGI